MLREAIPEKDWTPWQREQMRNFDRLRARDRQWLRIEEWKIRQEHTHHYVCLADIVDWCARRPGDIERDPMRRMQAYFDLQHSILCGEFGKGDRLKVLYLGPEQPPIREAIRLRLDAEHLRAHRGRVLDHVLDLCWAPRELCLRWLVARAIAPPPWLLSATVQVKPDHAREAGKSGESTPAPSFSHASEDRIHAAIDAVYAASTGKPPNLKQVIPLIRAELLTTNETATWKQVEYCAKDRRHLEKRRPRGRTLKSEQTSGPNVDGSN